MIFCTFLFLLKYLEVKVSKNILLKLFATFLFYDRKSTEKKHINES